MLDMDGSFAIYRGSLFSSFIPFLIGAALRAHSARCVSRARPPCWGSRPHLIQYLLQMIGVSAEEDSSIFACLVTAGEISGR